MIGRGQLRTHDIDIRRRTRDDKPDNPPLDDPLQPSDVCASQEGGGPGHHTRLATGTRSH
jgi:hypothetical protein